jgi:hypothetical protein
MVNENKFYLYLKQDKQGCDYTIGCGEILIELNSFTLNEAQREIKGILEDYGFDGKERNLKEALILEFCNDMMSTYHEYLKERNVLLIKDKERYQLYLDLKKEFGGE